jgi:hypothetical protein
LSEPPRRLSRIPSNKWTEENIETKEQQLREVAENEVPTAPILRLFSLLADAIGEQGLKPTAKGNLPRNFCREAALAYWDEKTFKERTRYGSINREDDFADLHITRLVAELTGLVRKYKGRFILSRDCFDYLPIFTGKPASSRRP